MTSKAQVNAEMTLGTAGATKALKHVNSEIGHFAKEASHKTHEVFGDIGKEFTKVFAAGLSGGAIAGAFETIKEGFKKSISDENITAGFATIFKGAEKAKEATAALIEESEKHHFFTDNELLKAGSKLAPASGGSVEKMQEMVKLAEKLKVMSPTKSIDDATNAILSANAGRLRSLTTGFGIDAKLLDQAAKRHLQGVAAIEFALDKMGVTEKALDATDNSMQATFNSVKQSWEEIGKTAAEALGPAVKLEMDHLNEFFKQNKQEIADAFKTLGEASMSLANLGGKAITKIAEAPKAISALNFAAAGLSANIEGTFLRGLNWIHADKNTQARIALDDQISHDHSAAKALTKYYGSGYGSDVPPPQEARYASVAANQAYIHKDDPKPQAPAPPTNINLRITHPNSISPQVYSS